MAISVDSGAYPNHEHKKADEAARRRALKALDNIQDSVTILRRRLTGIGSSVNVEGADGHGLAGDVQDLSVHLAILEALRDVREWDAAERA